VWMVTYLTADNARQHRSPSSPCSRSGGRPGMADSSILHPGTADSSLRNHQVSHIHTMRPSLPMCEVSLAHSIPCALLRRALITCTRREPTGHADLRCTCCPITWALVDPSRGQALYVEHPFHAACGGVPKLCSICPCMPLNPCPIS